MHLGEGCLLGHDPCAVLCVLCVLLGELLKFHFGNITDRQCTNIWNSDECQVFDEHCTKTNTNLVCVTFVDSCLLEVLAQCTILSHTPLCLGRSLNRLTIDNVVIHGTQSTIKKWNKFTAEHRLLRDCELSFFFWSFGSISSMHVLLTP